MSTLAPTPTATTATTSDSLTATTNSTSVHQAPLTVQPPINGQMSLVHQSRNKKSLPLRAGSITYIEYQHLRFIVHDCPSDANLSEYMAEFKKYNVTDVVRVCEDSYSIIPLVDSGVQVHELKYDDGGVPPDAVLRAWLDLIQKRFSTSTSSNSVFMSIAENSTSDNFKNQVSSSKSANNLAPPPTTPEKPATTNDTPCIAVHCVAGLGRAPVLVAVALIENGMSPLDAIEYIRRRRRGAFNSRQIQYVDGYKKQKPRGGVMHTFGKLFNRNKDRSSTPSS